MSQRLPEFFLVWLLTALAPGPTSFMIMAQALRGGFRAAIPGLLGIQAGHLILLSLLYTGLSLTQGFMAEILPWLQRLGALYLIFVALQLLRAAFSKAEQKNPVPHEGNFLQALLTHISNPKAVLFCFALIPAYLDPHQALGPQIAVLGSIMMPLDLVVMSGYAWLAATGAQRLKRSMRWVDGIAGLLILYVGIRLLLDH